MKLDEETQKRLRRYQAIINEDRLQYGLSPLTLSTMKRNTSSGFKKNNCLFIRTVFGE